MNEVALVGARLSNEPLSSPDANHYSLVASRIRAGLVIPFLGAGVNLADRPDDGAWVPPSLPNAEELARYLAKQQDPYPEGEAQELLRVSLYMSARLGQWPLYEALHQVFAADYRPNTVHEFLARLPAVLRAEERPPLVVITTNYDDALERAFDECEEPYELVFYEAKRLDERWGRLWHRPAHSDEPRPIEVPNEYVEIDAGNPIILKIHGAVDRKNPDRDSFVITEDDYIEYIGRSQVSQLKLLTARMVRSHLLFLGYSLQDWNLRVLLQQIWQERKLTMKSWAIQRPDPKRSQLSVDVERELWDDRGKVELIFAPLSEYIASLAEFIPGLPSAQGPVP
jgi:NAD-dependent SIR2 family protein deacetylase